MYSPLAQSLHKDAQRLKTIIDLCGYVQDGSGTSATIFQEDATREWVLKTTGNKEFYVGKSARSAIDAAAKAQVNGEQEPSQQSVSSNTVHDIDLPPLPFASLGGIRPKTSLPFKTGFEHCNEGCSYGPAPHVCFYKIENAVIGQSELISEQDWPDTFEPDTQCPGLGVDHACGWSRKGTKKDANQ